MKQPQLWIIWGNWGPYHHARFAALRSAAGPALVWYLVWDDEASAARFRGTSGVRLLAARRAGYRTAVESVAGRSQPTIRIVIAPDTWNRWTRIPQLGSSE